MCYEPIDINYCTLSVNQINFNSFDIDFVDACTQIRFPVSFLRVCAPARISFILSAIAIALSYNTDIHQRHRQTHFMVCIQQADKCSTKITH